MHFPFAEPSPGRLVPDPDAVVSPASTTRPMTRGLPRTLTVTSSRALAPPGGSDAIDRLEFFRGPCMAVSRLLPSDY